MSLIEEQIAEEGLALVRQGRAEQGASVLVRGLTVRFRRYFERNRVPPDEAEELVNEFWLRVLTKESTRGDGRPVAWLWTIADRMLVDWARRRQAQSRAGTADRPSGETLLDDEGWAGLANTVAVAEAPHWLRLCIERAAFAFEQEEPRRAQVLRFVSERWSAEEIAVHYGATPPVTDKQKTAARNRVLDAVKRARGYFQHCRDEA